MVVLCTNPVCGHERPTRINNEPCPWCLAPMRAIGDDMMSKNDDSLSTEDRSNG